MSDQSATGFPSAPPVPAAHPGDIGSMTPPVPPAEPESLPQAQSEYVVLTVVPSGDMDAPEAVVLSELGRATVSGGPKKAIEAVLKNLADHSGEGTFYAVPARSFKPITRKVQTKVAWDS